MPTPPIVVCKQVCRLTWPENFGFDEVNVRISLCIISNRRGDQQDEIALRLIGGTCVVAQKPFDPGSS